MKLDTDKNRTRITTTMPITSKPTKPLTTTDASTITTTTTDIPSTTTSKQKTTTKPFAHVTDEPTERTTEIESDVTTVISILGKDPRLGDNDITASPIPSDEVPTTTVVSETSDTSTEPIARTTWNFIPNNTMTRRPATRFDTTLEIEDHRNASTTTTESPSTHSIVMMPEAITETVAGTTITGDGRFSAPDETTPSIESTVRPNIRQKCSSQMDCRTNEKCISNECLKICQTNGTKSDDCVQGIYDCRLSCI